MNPIFSDISYIQSHDKKRLRVGTSRGFLEKPDAMTIFFVSGKSEWIEKYDSFFQEVRTKFEERGRPVRFISFDHRGQGESNGTKVHARNFSYFAKDIAWIIDEFKVNEAKTLFFSHSMGGMITLLACMEGLIKPRAVFLSAPFLRLSKKAIPRPLIWTLSELLCLIGFSRAHTGAAHYEREPFENNILTHDRDKYTLVCSSPFKTRSPTFGWMRASFRAQRRLFSPRLISRMSCPLYLLSASEDKIVDPASHAEWSIMASRFSPHPVRFQLVDGAYHELFGESTQYTREVMQLIDLFLDEYLEEGEKI